MVQIINTILGLHKRNKSITKCIRNNITVFTEQWPIDKGTMYVFVLSLLL